jgi:hypothetical protein
MPGFVGTAGYWDGLAGGLLTYRAARKAAAAASKRSNASAHHSMLSCGDHAPRATHTLNVVMVTNWLQRALLQVLGPSWPV